LGIGSNNYAELMALRSLMMLASAKGLNRLQIYGDSMLVIKWMNEDQQIQDITLQPLAIQLKENKSQFELITFTHIYREHNVAADTLSKQGLLQDPGFLLLEEVLDGVSTETRLDI
jgi:ribonuclease HI